MAVPPPMAQDIGRAARHVGNVPVVPLVRTDRATVKPENQALSTLRINA